MIILPANTLSAGGYEVANSCRFNDGDSAYMHNTLSSSDGSDVKGTISFWTKRGTLGANMAVICGKKGNTERVTIGFSSDDYFEIQFQDNSNAYYWRSSAVYRDVAAWYNFVIHLDTGNATANSRARVWVNNSEITSWGTRETCPQNLKIGFFNGTDGNKRLVGARGGSSVDKYYDGYIAEVVVLNNTLDAATNFGEYDEDSPTIWKPKDVSGLTFGTNGFYLDFEDSAALGDDVSGNGNDFTVNNLTAIDQTTDTPTNNFCTLNALIGVGGDAGNKQVLSEGNLYVTGNQASWCHSRGTLSYSVGKWYWEAKITGKILDMNIGVSNTGTNLFFGTAQSQSGNTTIYPEGDKNINGTITYGVFTALSLGDIIGIAHNADDDTVTFYQNGSAILSDQSVSGGNDTTWTPASAVYNTTGFFSFNFGNPTFTISSGNSDGNSIGNFEYSVPSGYFALCTSNLATEG